MDPMTVLFWILVVIAAVIAIGFIGMSICFGVLAVTFLKLIKKVLEE